MAPKQKRGSTKLLDAWKARMLTEESVKEISDALEKSPATVQSANVLGGENATSVRVALSYDGDDMPICGNDIAFWLKWHINHGGVITPPKIIINGIPFPESVLLELEFGHANPAGTEGVSVPQELNTGTAGG